MVHFANLMRIKNDVYILVEVSIRINNGKNSNIFILFLSIKCIHLQKKLSQSTFCISCICQYHLLKTLMLSPVSVSVIRIILLLVLLYCQMNLSKNNFILFIL